MDMSIRKEQEHYPGHIIDYHDLWPEKRISQCSKATVPCHFQESFRPRSKMNTYRVPVFMVWSRFRSFELGNR